MSALDACKYLLVAAQMGILHKNETVAGSVHEFMLIVACSLQPVACSRNLEYSHRPHGIDASKTVIG